MSFGIILQTIKIFLLRYNAKLENDATGYLLTKVIWVSTWYREKGSGLNITADKTTIIRVGAELRNFGGKISLPFRLQAC